VADSYKKCIVESDGQDTIFTRVFDIMYNLKFPDEIAGRARVNSVTREWHGARGRGTSAARRTGGTEPDAAAS
jgi:hypothetical protein